MDTRAYLQWRIEEQQARKEQIRHRLEMVAYVVCMLGFAALWIAGWMIR